MSNLDDTAVYTKYDPEGMLARINEFPEVMLKAWQMAEDFKLPIGYDQINKVVILGMGGSAIGGDLVGGLLAEESTVPIQINRAYNLPAYVDAQTLVIASSYSGNTEETLSAFEKALATEAKKLVITTGGKLKQMAKKNGLPVFSFDYKAQPRAALAYSFLPILNFLQRLGLTGDRSAEVAEASAVLEQMAKKIGKKVPLQRNPAKKLALGLQSRLTIIYGADLLAEVARRWKDQLNENAKAWAFHDVFSELNHNSIVGYQFPLELAARIHVIILRSVYLPEQIIQRQQITAELLKKAKVRFQFIDGYGISPITQMMSLVLIGDYVSYYLAILNNTDPSPVPPIDFLKAELTKQKEK
jgi:glucose/mannose-6-phosphate isomerase